MSNRTPINFNARLAEEIKIWQNEELLDRQLADQLIARYPACDQENARGGAAVTVLTIIGAVLVGLGTLLYISANWQNISTLWKLAILVGAVIASHACAWFCKYEPGNRPKLGSALLLLGSLIYGAAIWLIAQMFNTELSPTTGLNTWFFGVVVSALVTRSVAVGVLASTILGLRLNCCESFGFMGTSIGASNGFEFALAMMIGLELARQLRSRAMTWVNLVFASIFILFQGHTGLIGLMMWGLLLFGAYLLAEKYWPLMQSPLKYMGTTCTLFSLLMLTFKDAHSFEPTPSIVNLTGLICGTLLTLICAALKVEKYRKEAVAAAVLAVFALACNNHDLEMQRLFAFNFALVATILLLARSALYSLQSAGLATYCIIFAVLDIICRYFDTFFSMMDRSLFFVIGGVILMTAGAMAEKSRRYFLGSISNA